MPIQQVILSNDQYSISLDYPANMGVKQYQSPLPASSVSDQRKAYKDSSDTEDKHFVGLHRCQSFYAPRLDG